MSQADSVPAVRPKSLLDPRKTFVYILIMGMETLQCGWKQEFEFKKEQSTILLMTSRKHLSFNFIGLQLNQYNLHKSC